MKIDLQKTRFPKMLGMAEERAKLIYDSITEAISSRFDDNLEANISAGDIAARVAHLIETPEEGFYCGFTISQILEQLKRIYGTKL